MGMEDDIRKAAEKAGADASVYGFRRGDYRISQQIDELVDYCSFLLRQKMPILSYLEIGIAGGGMVRFMAELMNLDKVCTIDLGDHHSADMQGNNLAGVAKCVADVRHFRGSSHSDSAKAWLADEVFDLILVDGDHTQEGCADDVLLSLDHLADGGLLAVHDTNGDPSVRAWREQFDEKKYGLQCVLQLAHAPGTPGMIVFRCEGE